MTMTDFRTIAKLAEERLNAAVNKFDQTRSRDCDAIMLQPAKWVVKPEPESFKNEPAENCVDCKQPTRMWTLDGHTPLCKACCEKRNAPGK